MAFRPNPVKLSCTQCNWHKIIAPKSDVVPNDYFLDECPKCDGELQRKPLNNLFSSLIRLLNS
ncbi:hypothetical protein AAEU29_10500 [Pseudoalteromonas sp. SSM20]|uniref:hypothetical protein n=1 Tax=Pseudoalteromonas sp. SSM20 TaxID=3139394 RepID=UPI003BA95C86